MPLNIINCEDELVPDEQQEEGGEEEGGDQEAVPQGGDQGVRWEA